MPSIIIDREYTITVPVEITYEMEADDDGCGSPSKTGNSMTGFRGKRPALVNATTADNAATAKAVIAAILDDAMDAFEAAMEKEGL